MKDSHTATERHFHIGAQNDSLYIISGEAPALNNDYPNHEADRTCIAKIFDEAEARRLVDAANKTLQSAVAEFDVAASNATEITHCRDGQACTNLPTGRCWGRCVKDSVIKPSSANKASDPVCATCGTMTCRVCPTCSADTLGMDTNGD